MRKFLFLLILFPITSYAEFDIKGLFRLPKQLDSEVHISYLHNSYDSNYYEGGTKIVDGEITSNILKMTYHFGLFDDLTLVLSFNKLTRVEKKNFLKQSNGLLEARDWSGFSDPTIGTIARIKKGIKSSIFMDILFNFSPGIFDREYPAAKFSSNVGSSEGKPGNNGNGGHIFEGGVQFGKPMSGDWEWQGKLLYKLYMKADEIDQSDHSKDIISAYGSYLLSFRAQRYIQSDEHTLWTELSYQQSSSHSKLDSTGSSEQIPTKTRFDLKLGLRSSLLWKSLYGGIYAGFGYISDIDGISNGTTVKISDQRPQTIGLEFKIKI